MTNVQSYTERPEALFDQATFHAAHELLDGLHVPEGDLVTRLNTLADLLRRFVLAWQASRADLSAFVAGAISAQGLGDSYAYHVYHAIADELTAMVRGQGVPAETQSPPEVIAEARLIIATYRRDHDLEHSCDSDPCDNCTLAAQWLKSTER